MLRALALSLTLLATAPAVAQPAEWSPLATTEGNAMSWRPVGPSPDNASWRRVEVMANLVQSQVISGFEARSVISSYDIDCAQSRAIDVEWSGFAGLDLTGEQRSFRPDRAWLTFDPSAIGTSFLAKACQ